VHGHFILNKLDKLGYTLMKRTKLLAFLLLYTIGLHVCGPLFAFTQEQSEVALEALPSGAKGATVLLIAGEPSNKAGQHEYFAGCTLLAKWLRQHSDVIPVQAANGWPKDETLIDRAKCIVVFADGGPKLPFLQPERMARLGAAMKRGAGFVMLHQAVDVPNAVASEIGDWLGAVWQPDIGSRGHWDMEFNEFPSHAVTRGVTSFAAPLDGWLFNLHFRKGAVPVASGMVPDKNRSTADAKANIGRAEVIGWAYERPSGGRSFGFTGCDLHRNWGVEGQRKLVVNGILWAAGVDVPMEGASVRNETADLLRWMDEKAKPAAAVKQ
jgi:hypothetical protein